MDTMAKRIKMFVKYAKSYTFFAWAVSFFLTAPVLPTAYSLTENNKEPVMTEVIFDESYNGRKIEVFSNSRVLLRLPENPSTGYRWEMEPLNGDILKLQSDTYEAPTAISMGAGGTRVLEFIAQSPGTVHLRLHLKRPWDSASVTTKVFEITVQVLLSKPKQDG